jgi:hypothetical protein
VKRYFSFTLMSKSSKGGPKKKRKSEAKNDVSKKRSKTECIAIKESFSGTVNTIKRAAFGAPGSGRKPSISYFQSTLISSQNDLEVFCNKIKRHGHSRVKGPSGRVSVASPLAEACEAMSIDFDNGEMVVVAVWSNRRREASIEGIHVDADTITVELHNEGVDRSSTQSSSGVKYGSYAAAVVAWKDDKKRVLKFGGDTDKLLS